MNNETMNQNAMTTDDLRERSTKEPRLQNGA